MSDLAIFIVGTIVTGMVVGAVCLLFWGAASEPGPGEPIEPHGEPPDPIGDAARGLGVDGGGTSRSTA